MEINVPLFRKTVEWVEEQAQLAVKDRRWYQPAYVQMNILAAQEDLNDPLCGTAMCFAGKIAIDAGWKPVLISVDSANGIVEADTAEKDGVTRDIDIIACDELGINEWDLNSLFDGTNDAADIRSIAEGIVGERL